MSNVQCPHCGQTVGETDAFCPFCGKRITYLSRCPVCGNELNGAKFCSKCGYKAKDKSSEVSAKAKNAVKNVAKSVWDFIKDHKKIFIIVAAVILIAVIVIPTAVSLASPFRQAKVKKIELGVTTQEDIKKKFGKPTDEYRLNAMSGGDAALLFSASLFIGTGNDVWVYYESSVAKKVEKINEKMDKAEDFDELDKLDAELEKATKKPYKSIVVAFDADGKVTFIALNTKTKYDDSDLFATSKTKTLKSVELSQNKVCIGSSISECKLSYTAKFSDKSMIKGYVTELDSAVDTSKEGAAKISFSNRWGKYSANINVGDHDRDENCICKICGEENHKIATHCQCTLCGKQFEHKYSSQFTVDVQPTCKHDGSKSKHCTLCGDASEITLIKRLPHTYEDGICASCGRKEPPENMIFKYDEDGYYVLTEYTGSATEVVIPDTYDDDEHGELPIKEIGYSVFGDNTTLTSITIPDNVTSIGSSAFYKCSGLTSVTIGSGIISIGNYAFSSCSGLTSITIPDSVTSIGSSAFYECRGLTSITIPNSVKSVGYNAFGNCSGLTSIYYMGDIAGWCGLGNLMSSSRTLYIGGNKIEGDLVIPDGVTSIGNLAFYNCSELTSITIPDSVTSIGNSAFEYCSGLTSVTIGSGVTSIGEKAFYNCSGLTSVKISNGVTSIGEKAFYNCSGLTTVNWNATACTSAGDNYNPIFGGYTKLSTVNIGNNVTTIPSYAFYNCSELTSITIPDSVTSIGDSVFEGCIGLTEIEVSESNTIYSSKDGILYDKEQTKFLYIPKNLQGSIAIPASVTSIGEYAFSYCSGLTSITIPDSVTSIGEKAFYNCSGLTSVTIGSGVTSIGEYAFSYCSGLTSITIPDSVTSIGEKAFYNCSGLTSVTIGSGVTSIGEYAFYICYKLVEVYNKSPLNITAGSDAYGYVGYYAKNVYTEERQTKLTTDENGYIIYTDGDTKLLLGYTGGKADIVLPQGITEIYQYAFYDNEKLNTVTIPDSVTSIGEKAFSGCSGLTSVTIGSGVTSIGDSAFSICYKLVEVYNKSSLNITAGSRAYGYVGYYAKNVYTEERQTKLTTDENGYIIYTDGDTKLLLGYTGGKADIVLPQGITEIYQYAFYDNEKLNTVTIPDSVTSIGGSAFSYCSGLTSITIPDSVTSIGDLAFSGCSGLTSITIPNGVTSIGYDTFYNCSGLTSITIPDSVTFIGVQVFSYCSGLTEIRFNGTMSQWKKISKDSSWNYYTGNYKVYCTDGTLNK